MATMTITTMRSTRLRDGSEQGNADMMNGAMTKTKARTMLTPWCYLCYNDKDKGDRRYDATMTRATLGVMRVQGCDDK